MNDKSLNDRNDGFNQARTTIEIELWVKALIERSGPYVPGRTKRQRESMCFGVVQELPRLIKFYRLHHEYSEHIVAFWHACEKYGILDCGQPTSTLHQLLTLRIDSSKAVEELAALVLDYASSQDFRRREFDRWYEQKRRRERLEKYVRGVLRKYARTLVLRLDLGYRKEFPVDIAVVYDDLDDLIISIRQRTGIFKDLIGYVIAVEQGREKGYHIHVAFFLPGHLHQRDGYLIKQCGALWKGITEGRGVFHSCNAEKDRFEALGLRGVGMIYRDDERSVENVVRTVGYLADPDKDDQHLRIKPAGRRSLFTGM